MPTESRGILLFVQHASNLSGSTMSGLLAVRGLRRAGWQVHVALGSEGPAVAAFAREGCMTHIVPHKNWLRGGDALRSLWRIIEEYRNAAPFTRLIDEIKPQLVYVNSLVSLAGAVAGRRRRLPVVWHARELFSDLDGDLHPPLIGGRMLVRAMLRWHASRFIAISRCVVENVLGGGDAEIVPNAVDAAFFNVDLTPHEARRQLGLPADAVVLGGAGAVRPIKGFEQLIEAAGRIAGSVENLRVVIAGGGSSDAMQSLRDVAARHGISDRLVLLGEITAMPTFLRACDILCIPSRSESFGRTAIEAFAVGIPVIANAVGGLREVIDDGRTGLLVPAGDAASMADAAARLLSDAAERQRLAAAARSEAQRRFTAAAYEARIAEIVAEVVRPAPASPEVEMSTR